MKKIIYLLMFLGVFLIVSDSVMAQNCRPNANQIAVFEHSGYRGKCAVRNVGNYPSARSFGLPNDSISSIIIGRNVFAILYEHNSFKGKKQTFSRTDTTLTNNSVGNDAVSSIRVISKNYSPPNSRYRSCANEGQRCNFRGKGTVAFGLNGTFKYKRNVSGSIACNNRTFGDPFPGVAKRCYFLPQRTNTPTPTAQSCRPNANQVAIFYDSNYQGRCRIRNIGDYPSAKSIGLPNDSISSIVVGSNVGAVLCRDVKYKGTCETYRGNDSFLGNNRIGNDQVSSIKVFRKVNRPINRPTPRANHAPPNSNYKFCAKEGQKCNYGGIVKIAYGVNGKFKYKSFRSRETGPGRYVSTSAVCNSRNFGGDPVPGVLKRCYIQGRGPGSTTGVITGRNVKIVRFNGGKFRQISNGKVWAEYKSNNAEHARFTEIRRDRWNVYLRKSDGARIQLDLRNKVITLNGRRLYTITSVWAP